MGFLNNLPLPLYFLVFVLFQLFCAISSTEFLVGDQHGWAVPNQTESGRYNKWASHNRFNLNDTLHFKYEKDSVMEVTEEEYKQCLSSKPLFFDSNGDTIVTLDRAGLFYFISGVSGHCQKGQRMIIKVLEPLTPPQPPATQPQEKNSAVSVFVSVSSLMFGMFLASVLFL